MTKHKKDEGIDMTSFFKEQAAKGRNPFSLVTHVNGKQIRSHCELCGRKLKKPETDLRNCAVCSRCIRKQKQGMYLGILATGDNMGERD